MYQILLDKGVFDSKKNTLAYCTLVIVTTVTVLWNRPKMTYDGIFLTTMYQIVLDNSLINLQKKCTSLTHFSINYCNSIIMYLTQGE
jgi:hypothetical protein